MNESDLISVARAIEIIDSIPVAPRVQRVRLEQAQGYHLAQDIVSDRDYPPFHKSQMDGYAVRCDDVRSAPVELKVVGEVAAGAQFGRELNAGEAVAIMTGAPIPEGADGVVPVEDALPLPPGEGGGEGPAKEKTDDFGNSSIPTILRPPALTLTLSRGERGPDARVRILRAEGAAKFITFRGADCAAGAVVLRRGTKLEAAQLAVAASVGAGEVDVFAKPRAAVLSTGDEVVPPDAVPGAAQIRNSNNLMLAAMLRRQGCEVTDLGIRPDIPLEIRHAIEQALAGFDVLLVSGGMSMGQYDYVPKILLDLGVELKITKLRIKPGKPFVFGVWKGSGFRVQGSGDEGSGFRVQGSGDEGSGFRVQGSGSEDAPALNPKPSTLNPSFVFGLPGNPVSGFVCALRLCSRLIARLGGAVVSERRIRATLQAPLEANGVREFYQPAVLNGAGVMPLRWKGSADIYTLAQADALIIRPENAPPLAMGAEVDVLEVAS